jgi:hypothetical protein
MDFNVRSDSIDVEQIMEQIRSRIREKRGVDYTEQQLRELAAVKLEKFLDPRGVRSDLLEQFRQHQPRYEPPIVAWFSFEDTTMFETHRGALRWIRKLLSPLLKLFFNPNALIHALHAQSEINEANFDREVARENQRRDMDALYFEVIHNLVFEMTRTGIEVKNLKMRVESLASRLEFSERRARALEGVVAYKPSGDERNEPPAVQNAPRSRTPPSSYPQPAMPQAPRPAPPPPPAGQPAEAAGAIAVPSATVSPETGIAPESPGQRSRRRRRRRGRRSGAPASGLMSPSTDPGQGSDVEPPSQTTAEEPFAAGPEDDENTAPFDHAPRTEYPSAEPRRQHEQSELASGPEHSAATDSERSPVTGSDASDSDRGSDPDQQ